MYIRSILGIPRFIGLYFNKGEVNSNYINEFSDVLLNSAYFSREPNKYFAILNYKPKLIDFYIDKSKLDYNYRCKYEEELDIAKSIYNELYTIKIIGGKILKVSLDYIENEDILVLNVEE